MENNLISIEFTQEEIDDLIEELISTSSLLANCKDEQIRNLHIDESRDVQDMFVSLHNFRKEFTENMINKLANYTDLLD